MSIPILLFFLLIFLQNVAEA